MNRPPKKYLELANRFLWKPAGKIVRDAESGIDVGVYREGGLTVVSVAPSNEDRDWSTNLNFLLSPWSKPSYARPDTKVRAHRGYLRGWERIREEVLSLVATDEVLVCGFSMGGGVSNLVAVDIQYNRDPKTLWCFNMGGARIWNKAGVESFNRRVPNCIHFVNGNDVVSKSAPLCWSGGETVRFGRKYLPWIFSVKDHALFADSFRREIVDAAVD